MKITKFTHSCLLVEMPEPVNRTALFDPGMYSTIQIDKLQYLDDIIITHAHPDHMDVELIKQLHAKFPKVRITAPQEAQVALTQAGLGNVATATPEGVQLFDAPHEPIEPLGTAALPQESGIHYLHMLTNPGDSHHFRESMPILALPVTGPWGSVVRAVEVALLVRPKHILPIHDWHWHDQARTEMYDRLEQRFAEEGMTFYKLVDGEPVVIKDAELAAEATK